MKILQILVDKELSTEPAEPVKEITQELKDLAINMCITMTNKRALGIAAPQVGVPVRIMVINSCTYAKDSNAMGCAIMINPEIIDAHGSRSGKEGCLSFPGRQVEITRHKTVTVKWQNTQGVYIESSFMGLAAACVQHEIDHLNGKTFLEESEWKL